MSADLGHNRRRAAARAEWALVHLALLAAVLFFGAPFLWIIAAAFDRAPTANIPWPREPSLENFRFLFAELDMGLAIRNSLVVSVPTMLLATCSVALAGYALSRWPFRRKTVLSYAILLLQTMPLAATMVPIYDLTGRLDLHDTYRGLILTHASLSLPFLIWLMKGFFDAVPRDLEEAAWVDGASRLGSLRQILLPQAKPGLAVVAGFSFIYAWAEVLLVIILVTDFRKATIPFTFFYAATENEAIPITAAIAVLYILPVLLLFLALRRLMVRGITGGVTGV